MNLAKLGLGALNAAQYKLQTSAHNINNSAVEGYNRQTVLTQTAGSTATGAGYVGRGVKTVTVVRSYDNFLYEQLVAARGQGKALQTYGTEIKQLDTLFADRSVGVAPALQGFFDSVNAVASAPADPAAREEMLGQANNLASQLRETNQYLDRQRNNLNSQITTVVDQINSYVERIRDANAQIVKARASASQHDPNDLLDQRDQLVSELNELVGVTVYEQDGNFNLAIGNGQILLGGVTAYPLKAQPSEADPQRVVVAYTVGQGSSATAVEMEESYIRGGQLGGLIQYRQEVLDDVQNNLGRVAVGIALAFNEVHQGGMDLHGNIGDDVSQFFSIDAPRSIPNSGNAATSGNVKVTFDNAKDLTGDDYTISYDGVDFVITNQTTKQEVGRLQSTDTSRTVVVEGLKFDFTGMAAANGDEWEVQPTRATAGSIKVEITDPAKIAAAAPGTGEANGDIALKLAQLQHGKTLGGSQNSAASMSVNEAFSQIVNRVGVLSQQNKTASKAQESLIQQTFAAQQEVSGVNLNEEYVNLEQYMEQFRAASRLIDVSSTLFDTLLNMR
jgi:flagellar hook-associated protein FlgK